MFTNKIPDIILQNEHTARYVQVIEELLKFKTLEISNNLRMYNTVLCLNKKWLIYKLSELGYDMIPMDLPEAILEQLLLNANTIENLRGSKIGLELLISTLTLGEVTFDDSLFFSDPLYLIPDSVSKGFISESSIDPLFLLSNSDELNNSMPIIFTIKTKYFDTPYWDTIRKTLTKVIPEYLPFSKDIILTINVSTRDNYYYHQLLNKHFV